MTDMSRSLRAAVFATYAAIIVAWQVVGAATFKHPTSLFPPPSRIFSFIWETREGLTTAAGRTSIPAPKPTTCWRTVAATGSVECRSGAGELFAGSDQRPSTPD